MYCLGFKNILSDLCQCIVRDEGICCVSLPENIVPISEQSSAVSNPLTALFGECSVACFVRVSFVNVHPTKALLNKAWASPSSK